VLNYKYYIKIIFFPTYRYQYLFGKAKTCGAQAQKQATHTDMAGNILTATHIQHESFEGSKIKNKDLNHYKAIIVQYLTSTLPGHFARMHI
jgi:hypothetical protein